MDIPSPARATAFGFVAILLWSTSVGLLRSLSEHFGATGGAALVYSTAAVCLFITRGIDDIRQLSSRYLWIGGGLFVSYEICLALSIGLAHNRSQSLELGMINYLWPALTLVLARFINQQRSHFWLWPGLVLSLAGIAQVMKGNQGWSAETLWHHVLDSPLPYCLALLAAIIWALYCNLTRRLSGGKNGVPLFFTATAGILWIMFYLGDEPALTFSLFPSLQLLFMGLSTAIAYFAWNHSIQYGNLTLLATTSYFTPVLSALLASTWLGLQPSLPFWIGVGMIVAGSLLCWLATRCHKTQPADLTRNTSK